MENERDYVIPPQQKTFDKNTCTMNSKACRLQLTILVALKHI